MKKQRKAFTMIEVIFVIVIIGILASVAIPRLVANRDDAEATICVHEVGQLLHELSNGYTKVGYVIFKTKVASQLTNIELMTVSNKKGIKNNVLVDTTGITYVCDGTDLVSIVGSNTGRDYNLTVTVLPGVSPVSKIAAKSIIKDVIGGSSPKIFSL